MLYSVTCPVFTPTHNLSVKSW